MKPLADTSRLSLNQYTTHGWSVREAAEGCRRAGLEWIGLWRDKVEQAGLAETARILSDNDLRCSGLCRGGWFPAPTAAERQARIEDNLRAIEQCSALSCDTLVLVCGPPHSKDIAGARRMVEEGITAIDSAALARGVRLGIEPLHPMFAGDRSVINTMGQALDAAERIGSPNVGVIIDAYHVWWDPDIYAQIERARGRIWGFHVSDWLAPPPDVLMGRGMMGDGIIELRRLRAAVDAVGYDGPIECEIFNSDIWNTSGDEVLQTMMARYLQHC